MMVLGPPAEGAGADMVLMSTRFGMKREKGVENGHLQWSLGPDVFT